jgi:hypothetical protein
VSLLLRVPGRQLLILGRRVTPHRTSRRSSGVDVSGTCVSPLSSTVMPRSTCGMESLARTLHGSLGCLFLLLLFSYCYYSELIWIQRSARQCSGTMVLG